jgi:hypothetical protein
MIIGFIDFEEDDDSKEEDINPEDGLKEEGPGDFDFPPACSSATNGTCMRARLFNSVSNRSLQTLLFQRSGAKR